MLQGVVSSVEDEDAGIYMLDGRVQLVITYLKDITCELWNGPSTLQSENEGTPKRMAEFQREAFKRASEELKGDLYGKKEDLPRVRMAPETDIELTASWLPDGQQLKPERGGSVKKSGDSEMYTRPKRKLIFNQIPGGSTQNIKIQCQPKGNVTQDSCQENENREGYQATIQEDKKCQSNIQHTTQNKDKSQDSKGNEITVHDTILKDKTRNTSEEREEDVRQHRCLEEGDSVMVYQAHHDRKEGRPRLICCGRSLVVNTR